MRQWISQEGPRGTAGDCGEPAGHLLQHLIAGRSKLIRSLGASFTTTQGRLSVMHHTSRSRACDRGTWARTRGSQIDSTAAEGEGEGDEEEKRQGQERWAGCSKWRCFRTSCSDVACLKVPKSSGLVRSVHRSNGHNKRSYAL